MTVKQKQDKLDKRAKALRENLRKRKPVKKPASKTSAPAPDKKDNE